MPTPSDSADELPLPTEHTNHSSCPPELDRPAEWRVQLLEQMDCTNSAVDAAATNNDEQPSESQATKEEPSVDILCTTSDHPKHPNTPFSDADPSSPPTLKYSAHIYRPEANENALVTPGTPASSALDLSLSSRLGLDSRRVRD